MRIFLRLPVLFLLLAFFIGAELLGGPTNSFEVMVIRWLAEIRAEMPALTRATIVLTEYGGALATLGLMAIFAIWLFWKRAYGRALLLIVTVLAERNIVEGLKLLFVRPRPAFDVHPVMIGSWSYPSGHSANSMTAYLAIALIAVPFAWRRPAILTAAVLVALIGASRCYLGVHWPSDVIGGWSLGLIAVWIALAAGERSGALRLEAQHDIIGGHRPPVAKDETA